MAPFIKVVVDRNIPLVEKAFGSLGEVTAINSDSFCAESVHDADALIIRSETKVDRILLDGSNVKFVGTATIGTDHIDLDYLASRRIAIADAAGCNSNSVKEYVVSALLYLSQSMGYSFKGKTIGVVGVGNIGSKVVKVAEALGMNVLQNDPPLARKTGNMRFVSLNELNSADIVTVHVPLTRAGDDPTYQLFDRDRLHKIKQGAIFINTSRGAIVETEALKEVVAQKRLGAAIIDVWENEPKIDTELLSMVTIGTAHIAGYSLEGRINGMLMVCKKFCDFFGMKPDWDHTKELPPPEITDIKLIPQLETIERIVHCVVERCYDISIDDTNLKRLSILPEKEQPGYFRKLRSVYRNRREFHNVTVQIPDENKALADIFIALGYGISKY